MIHYRFKADMLGDDPAQTYSELLDSLIAQHTDNVFEAFMPCELVIRKDNKDYRLDDEVIRYADTNVTVYSLEEKVDPDYFHIALQYSNEKGHKQMLALMKDIENHPATDGRVRGLRIVGIISDDPQCIPCMKRRKEKAEREGRLRSLSELFPQKVVK